MRTQLLACDILSRRRANSMYVKSVISYGAVVLQHVCNLEPLLDLKQNSSKSQCWILDKRVINGFDWNLTKNAFCEGGTFWARQWSSANAYYEYVTKREANKMIDFQPNSNWKQKKTALRRPGSISKHLPVQIHYIKASSNTLHTD